MDRPVQGLMMPVRVHQVVTMLVQCSLQVRHLDSPDPSAASDTCRAHATSAVVVPQPSGGPHFLWRCGEHAGLISLRPLATGEILFEIPRITV